MKAVGAFVWGVALVAAASLIGGLVIFESASFLGFAINGDTLHLALAVWDYSAHDYAREGFSISRVPSLVPDIAVYGMVQLATGSWRLASLAFGVLSLIGLATAAGYIVREIAGGAWRTATQAFLLLTLLILMLELPVTAASEHMHIFLPNNHGGPFILALAALCVVWVWLQRPTNGKLLLLLALVTAGVLSDLLFVISCVGPTIVALAYSLVRRKIAPRRAVPIVACLALGTLAGRVLGGFLVHDGGVSIDWATVPVHARAFLASAGELAAAAPLTALVAYGLPLALFLCSPLLFRAPATRPRALDAVEYWWVLSASSVLATLLATPLVYEGTWHYRYMMPLLWWPIVWTSALVVRALGAARSPAIPVGLTGVAAVLGFAYVSPGLRTPALLALHHPLEACLLEGQRTLGLKAGLGDYWHARYVEASSDWRLQIDQVEPDGSGMWWSNDRFWYTHDVHDGARPPGEPMASPRPPEYNYIIMADLDERAIKSHYGAPDRTLDCGGSAIWVYDDPAAVRRALVRTSPPLYATFLEAGQGIDRICIPADRFASASRASGPERLAPLEGPLEARVETADDRRPRTWGPAFGLPSGRWTIALDYSLVSDMPGRDRWDISTGWGYKTIYEATLAPTGGETRTVQTEIDLETPAQGIEIRTFLAGTGTVAIRGAEIARAGAGGRADCDN
ncbi:MAG TPA: hypothetical protein VN823_09660 [Stellaceae bacterium]|nr:hypothetical protein [Stellaceae bacterium]